MHFAESFLPCFHMRELLFKCLLLSGLWMTGIAPAKAQLLPFVQWMKPVNRFFAYDYQPFQVISNQNSGDTILIRLDPFNLCRIRCNKIKKLEIYEWKNLRDSSLVKTIYYGSDGMIDSIIPREFWSGYPLKPVNSSSIHDCSCAKGSVLYYDSVLRSKGVRYKQQDYIKTRFYDSLAYLTEEIRQSRSYRHWLIRNLTFGSLSSLKRKFSYYNNYQAVKIQSVLDYTIDIEQVPYDDRDVTLFEMDERYNLLREMLVNSDLTGTILKWEGYSYVYYNYE